MEEEEEDAHGRRCKDKVEEERNEIGERRKGRRRRRGEKQYIDARDK